MKSHQLSGLVHWPRSWLCSVSTVLAQNNFPASWPTSTFLLHQSGLDWTKFVPVGPACPVNPSITLPKAALILYHKFSPQDLPHSLPLFTQPAFSPSLVFHSHLFLCHFLSLPLPVVYLFAHRAVFFFSPSPVSPPGSLQKNFHLSSFLDSKRWTNRCSLCVVLRTAVDVYDTHTHTQSHATGCVGCVVLPAGTFASPNHYMQFHYILNRRISKPLSLWALLYLPPPVRMPVHVHALVFMRVLSVRVCRPMCKQVPPRQWFQVRTFLYLCLGAAMLVQYNYFLVWKLCVLIAVY